MLAKSEVVEESQQNHRGMVTCMTVKEIKEKLAEMPDEAEVIVIDSLLCGNEIIAIKHRESTIHKDGVVQICTYD